MGLAVTMLFFVLFVWGCARRRRGDERKRSGEEREHNKKVLTTEGTVGGSVHLCVCACTQSALRRFVCGRG